LQIRNFSIMKAFSRAFLPIVAACVAATSFAGSWNWTRPYKDPTKTITTLIVIGNYRKPRLMADIIQAETFQPILLIPADSDGKIFFMPAKDTTMEVEFDDLRTFIQYLKPEQIVVLGDERYVPKKYLKQIDPKQTVISITNKSWRKIAAMAQDVMNLAYLKREFDKVEAKIESGELYRPSVPTPMDSPDAKTADVIVDTPTEVVETSETEIVVDEGAAKDADSAKKDVTKDSDEKTLPEPKLIEDKVVPK